MTSQSNGLSERPFIPRHIRFAAAHRVAPQLDAVGIVDDPVEDGVGIGRIADRVVPALDWDLRGQDRGGTLVAIVDDLHQVATLLGGKPGHGPIVDYEQFYPGELGEQPGGLAVDAGEGELVEMPGKSLIAHREPATRGLVADGASEETLAATGRAQDQNIVVLVQPAATGEAVDQAAVETARSAVVDGLAIDQHRQALVEAEAIAVGQALLLLERLGHAGEA